LVTAGQVSAGGNITGANLSVTNAVIVGNLTVTGSTEYINVATVAIQDPIISVGRGANNAALSSNDNKDRGEQLYYYDTQERSAFIGYQSSSGKLIAATRATITSEVVTINTYGSFVVGQLEGSTINMSGTATVGNVSTTGTISATGTITGGNLTTIGSVGATGGVTGGNLLTGGNVSAAGTVIGSVITATGNITGGNVLGTGLVVSGNTATVTTANYTIGYRDIPQITSFGTLAATDGGKHYYGSGTITIPANSSISLSIGTSVLIIASGSTTIANAAGVTLTWAGPGTGGSRTLAQYGMATLVKVATDTWYINGTGLS
jgi:hypothetical protein